MTVWILVGPDGKPFKGNAWRPGGRIKAFDNQLSANISAGRYSGVVVKKVEVDA